MILRPDICTFQPNCTRPPALSPVSAANSEPASTTLTHLYELSIESARNSALTAIIETELVTRIEAYMNVLPQSLTPCSYSLDPNSPLLPSQHGLTNLSTAANANPPHRPRRTRTRPLLPNLHHSQHPHHTRHPLTFKTHPPRLTNNLAPTTRRDLSLTNPHPTPQRLQHHHLRNRLRRILIPTAQARPRRPLCWPPAQIARQKQDLVLPLAVGLRLRRDGGRWGTDAVVRCAEADPSSSPQGSA